MASNRKKQFWLKDGDINTCFFHASASTRKQVNKTNRIKDDNGIWHEEQDKICEVVMEYLQYLFSDNNIITNDVLDDIQTCDT